MSHFLNLNGLQNLKNPELQLQKEKEHDLVH